MQQPQQNLYPSLDNNMAQVQPIPIVVAQQPQQAVYQHIDSHHEESLPLAYSETISSEPAVDANGNPVIAKYSGSKLTPEERKRDVKNILSVVAAGVCAQMCFAICIMLLYGAANLFSFFVGSVANNATYMPASNCTILSRDTISHPCNKKSSATCFDIVFTISFTPAPENDTLTRQSVRTVVNSVKDYKFERLGFAPQIESDSLDAAVIEHLQQASSSQQIILSENQKIGYYNFSRNLDAKSLKNIINWLDTRRQDLKVGTNQDACWWKENWNSHYNLVLLQEPVVMFPVLIISLALVCCGCIPCCCCCGCLVATVKKAKVLLADHKAQTLRLNASHVSASENNTTF